MPHVLEALLPGQRTLVCGLRDIDMTAFGGHRVHSLATARALLGSSSVNLVHFGGEILACRVEEAMAMLLEGEDAARFEGLMGSHPGLAAVLARLALGTENPLGYVTGRSTFPRLNRLAFHAVGLASPQGLNANQRYLDVCLCSADFVGVRDSAALAYAESIGLMAHAMPCGTVLVKELFAGTVAEHVAAAEVNQIRVRFPAGYAAFQVSAAFATRGHSLAHDLKRFGERTGLGLVLFASGTAARHDSRVFLRHLVDALGAERACLLESANVWDIVGLISQARVYAGSSLHGRIVATAFGVPRLNFASSEPKVQCYCDLWELPGLPVRAPSPETTCESLLRCLEQDPAILAAHAQSLAARYRESWAKLQSLLVSESDRHAKGLRSAAAVTEFDRAAGALRELDLASLIEPSLHAQVFADQGAGYTEELSCRLALAARDWRTLRFQQLERLCHKPDRRLRLDPLNQPGLVEISTIRILRDRDGAVVFAAEMEADWAALECVGAVPIPGGGQSLLLMVTGADPQLYLPALPALPRDACTMEMCIRVETSATDMLRRIAHLARSNQALAHLAEEVKTQVARLEARDVCWQQTHAEECAAREAWLAERRSLEHEQRVLLQARDAALQRVAVQVTEFDVLRSELQMQQERALTMAREAQQLRSEVIALQQAVEAVLRWQKSWLKRTFHRWHPPWEQREDVGLLKRWERSIRKRRKEIVARALSGTRPSWAVPGGAGGSSISGNTTGASSVGGAEGAAPLMARGSIPSVAVYFSTCGNYFFQEIAQLIQTGMVRAGYRCHLRTELGGPEEDVDAHLVVAPHEFFVLGNGPACLASARRETVFLLNTEQRQTQWFRTAVPLFARACHVFDMDMATVLELQRLGHSASHLRLGHVEGFAPYARRARLLITPETEALGAAVASWIDFDRPLAERPIDLNFVGEANPRRTAFFAQLAPMLESYECHLRLMPQGLGPWRAESVRSNRRSQLTAGLSQRSKIVLNIHRDDAHYFEWHRIVMMGIWQRALVITETVSDTPPFMAGKDFVEASLAEMPQAIDYYLRDPRGIQEAEDIRTAGFKTLSEQVQFTAILQEAWHPFLPRLQAKS